MAFGVNALRHKSKLFLIKFMESQQKPKPFSQEVIQ
jgi:hypothetical protein